MSDGFASRWTGSWTAGAVRFNPNHAPAGSATGGQFAASGSSGSGSGKSGGGHAAKGGGVKTAPHASAKPVDAHQKHLAHLASHPNSPQARAARKQSLLEQARADREKIAQLRAQLKGLKSQEAKAAANAKHTAAAAAKAKAGPNAGKSLAHAAHARHTSAAKKHVTLKQQVAAVENRIAVLQEQVKADTAEAAKL